MSARKGATYSATRIAARVADLSKELVGRRLDVMVTLDGGFLFGADLIHQVSAPTACHFVRADVRDVNREGHAPARSFVWGAT